MSMSKVVVLSLCGAGAIWSVQGQEPSGQFYVRGGLGPALTMETEVEEFFGPVSGTEVEFDAGVRFEVAGGFQLTDWVAAEFETGCIYNEADSVTGTADSDFTLANVPFLANFVVQCPATPPFVPFLGAGVGFSASVIDIDSFTLGGTTVTGHESDIVLAYQAFAGFRYEFNEQMGVSFAYKYLGTGEPDWEASIGAAGKIGFGRIETHSVVASFNFKF